MSENGGWEKRSKARNIVDKVYRTEIDFIGQYSMKPATSERGRDFAIFSLEGKSFYDISLGFEPVVEKEVVSPCGFVMTSYKSREKFHMPMCLILKKF